MASVEKLAPFLLKWEGGYVCDPDDMGGATNMGVTMNTYIAYCRRKGYPVPTVTRLKNLSEKQWTEIVKTMYWDRFKGDAIESQSVANICVDWLWLSGTVAIKKVQEILGVKEDGIVGNKTLSAVNFADPDQLFEALFDARVKFLNDITNASIAKFERKIGRKATEKELLKHTNKRFLKGWLNRLNSIRTL